MGTVVLIVKISFIVFHAVFTRIVYISHVSKHDELVKSQRKRLEKGIIWFSTPATFICKFYIFMSLL